MVGALGLDRHGDALVVGARILKGPHVVALAVRQAPDADVLECDGVVVADGASRRSHIGAAENVRVANAVASLAELYWLDTKGSVY